MGRDPRAYDTTAQLWDTAPWLAGRTGKLEASPSSRLFIWELPHLLKAWVQGSEDPGGTGTVMRVGDKFSWPPGKL